MLFAAEGARGECFSLPNGAVANAFAAKPAVGIAASGQSFSGEAAAN
jgi:hypothetical protein